MSDVAGKLSDMTKEYRVTIRLSADLRRRIREAAHSKGTSESNVIRDAIEQRFAAKDGTNRAYDRAKKFGIIGVIKGTNPDLSTNPKYFDGFGS